MLGLKKLQGFFSRGKEPALCAGCLEWSCAPVFNLLTPLWAFLSFHVLFCLTWTRGESPEDRPTVDGPRCSLFIGVDVLW